MLGLTTAKRRKAALAIATAGAIVGLTAGSAAAAAPVTNAEAQAINATGALVEILDTGDCKTAVPVAKPGTGPRCGEGLDTDTVNAFSQTVEGFNDAAGTSRATASAAPIEIAELADVSLVDLISGIQAIDSGTVLDAVVDGIDPLLAPALQLLIPNVLAPLDAGLNTLLTALGDSLPISLEIGAVNSQCQATGKPLAASGGSTVTELTLVIKLADQEIRVPITLGSDPNTPILLSVADIVAGLTKGLQDTLTASLGGALAGLNTVVGAGDLLIKTIMDGLAPALQALGDGIAPLVKGTVNKQTPVSPSSTGQIEIIALELILLDGAGDAGRQTLQLARVACGKNAPGSNPTGAATPDEEDDEDDSDDSDDDEPKVVDSGINDGGNLGALAITGLLAASTLVGSAARQRLLLDR